MKKAPGTLRFRGHLWAFHAILDPLLLLDLLRFRETRFQAKADFIPRHCSTRNSELDDVRPRKEQACAVAMETTHAIRRLAPGRKRVVALSEVRITLSTVVKKLASKWKLRFNKVR